MSIDLLNETVIPMYVDGAAFTGSASFEVKDVHDSAHPTIHKVTSVTVDDVDKVVKAAQDAVPAWKKTSVPERRNIFLKAAALIRERIPQYAQIEYAETTSSQGWSGFDLTLAAESIEEVAASATVALRGEVATTGPGQRAYISRCPFGVVFGAAPWNAPVTLGQRACLQPIMAGNTAVLKTSELSPKTHLMIAQVMHDAGLPKGVLNLVHVAPQDAAKVVEAFIAHPAIGKINFTGSTRVGSIIAQTCGKYLKPCTMELGGKAPAVVCADADLEHAANAIMFGAWFHSGQVCMASQTAIVHESVKTKFLELINAHAPNVHASGDASKNAPLRGLFTEASAQRVKEIVDDAMSKGAKAAAGKVQVEGNVVQPLLLDNVTPDMRVYREEMFSPVFSIVTFKTEDEAIQIANDHEYGLAASVFTKNTDAGLRIADGIDAGMVHINGATVHDSAQMPHGGWKKSGFGRFNGIEGIREFTQLKVTTINDPHPYPI